MPQQLHICIHWHIIHTCTHRGSSTPTCREKKRTATHTRANDRSLFSWEQISGILLFYISVFFCERPKIRSWNWQIMNTWHEFGSGKQPLLYLSAFSQKFLCCHWKFQSVPNNLGGSQSTFPHHWGLHVPCVLLSKSVTYFLEGHGVKSLCV